MRKLFFSGSGCYATLMSCRVAGPADPPPATGQACETVDVSDTAQAPSDLRDMFAAPAWLREMGRTARLLVGVGAVVVAAREPGAPDREVARLTGGGP